MRIIITNTGNIWNFENPFLEQFRDIIFVVCLEGREATDKYLCFVSPYRQVEMGMDNYGAEDQKLKALISVAEKLNHELGYHEDIVFLSDNEPSTLYPYYVLKDLNKYNKFHLIAMPPWDFESRRRRDTYRQMLANLSALRSILYYDSQNILDAIGKKSTIAQAFDYARNYFGELMPSFLNGIYKMKRGPYFFDFASNSYIPLQDGFDKINVGKKSKLDKEINFPICREFWTLGKIVPLSYPEDKEYVKEEVEKPTARLDGKKVCNILREQRIRFAEANHIPFNSEPCPSIGPCAGTCEKCDMELKYLTKQARKIPEEQRIYPKFDPKEEMMV